MATIPAPTTDLHREEWEDADFDIPEGQPIHAGGAESDKEDDEDWDMEMDLGKTGAEKKRAVAGITAKFQALSSHKGPSPMITIRPPIHRDVSTTEEEEEDDDEGLSTIKAAASTIKASVFPNSYPDTQTPSIDEDMESAFALPSDLTQLSLAPLGLNHRSSKNSLEWGDQTSSSHSSDTYSSLGIADASPSSASATSASLPDTESDCDEDDSELDGLIFPAVFESGSAGKHLKKMLELKKKVQTQEGGIKVLSPPAEDDFEDGLVIDDEADLSASRLMQKTQQSRPFARSKSAPARAAALARPSSRAKLDRAKSPIFPPQSSARQLQKLQGSSSPSPPPKPSRSQTYREPPPPLPSTSFLSPKPGSLRGQKSHSGLSLKPPTPPSTQRKLTRKASLSSLMETSQSQALGSGLPPTAASSSNKLARYEIPTAASRAKSHTNSTSRIHGLDSIVPPTRPSTPSSNPVALRLTMPTSMRTKLRPALSAVFPAPSPNSAGGSAARASSPLPPHAPSRPPSSLSLRSRSRQSLNTPTNVLAPSSAAPKVLRRPKRQRMYGDGTELDAIDDLPTDRDKEGQYRVVPKGYGNRVPGGTYSSKQPGGEKDKGTIRRKDRRDSVSQSDSPDKPLASATNTLKRTGRIEFSVVKGLEQSTRRKKKEDSSPNAARKKPTLIRNLGGAGAPKVVGDMKWNPTSLRWEGNDQALKEFDAAVGTSTRPALITHLTGSSIGSPVGFGSFASGARKVGNMVFDPTRMCWISTVEEEEPDVFADMADDEDDWDTKGGTIRASLPLTNASSDTSTTSSATPQAPSPAPSRTRTMSESGSERGSRASMVCDVDESFLTTCHEVEERHRSEMKGWKVKRSDNLVEPGRSYLYEIRALATRKY